MDDLDSFVDDAAVNAFVSGINVDVSGFTGGPSEDASRQELAEALLEEDDMLMSGLLGGEYEKDIASGKYKELNIDQVCNILNDSELANMIYPKNFDRIKEFVETARKEQQVFTEVDVRELARAYIKTNI